ncbi:MAG: chloride channel protein [Akkermansia sp.]|nr:chloride channel protein [Akkermansia sp.]
MKHRADYRLLSRQLELMRLLRIGEQQAVLIQAVLMGLAGACAALLFEAATTAVQGLCTGDWLHNRVACFAALPPMVRVLLPCLGAVAAALPLLWARRVDKRRIPDYMEAFSLGNGRLPRRQGVLRSLSAVLSLGTGACIGKEGALMQIAAVAASAAGRWLHVSPHRLRLMVGCGAAAGMTAAFHTPLAACLFVSEVVVGSLSIGYLAPLLVASCAAYALVWCMGDSAALLPCAAGVITARDLLLCAAAAALLAPLGKLWVAWLGLARRALNGSAAWLVLRMAAAGLLVGAVAVYQPAIVGNGQEAMAALLTDELCLPEAAALWGLKALLVGIVFGVGTMGGVLTPTLMLGCFGGWVFGSLCGAESPAAFALVGMAAFFAAAARTPVTALLLAVELSMNAVLIFPLMAAVAVAYGLSRYLPGRSLYDSAHSGGLPKLTAGDIMVLCPVQVHEGADAARLAHAAMHHPHLPVPVVDAQGKYLGLRSAGEPLRKLPTVAPSDSLSEALRQFTCVPQEDYLAVVQGGRVAGLLSRTELYQTMALLFRRELAAKRR